MKGILIIIALLLNSHLSVFSQDVKIDSLESLLNSTRDYEEQVDLLSELSNAVAFHHSDSTLQYAKRALAVARQSNNKDLISKGFLTVGKALRTKRRHDEALMYYDSSFTIAKAIDNPLHVAHYHYEKARITIRNKNKTKEAKEQFEKAFQLYAEIPDTAMMGYSLQHRAVCEYYNGEVATAIETSNKSFELAKQVGNNKLMINNHNNIASYLSNQGKYNLAIDHLFTSLNIATDANIIRGKKNAHQGLGRAYYKIGEFDESLKHLKIAEKISLDIGDQKGAASALLSMGISYSKQGSYEKAIEVDIKCAEIMEAIGDDKGLSDAYTNIGKIYRQLKAPEKAMEFYRKSLAIKEKINDKSGIGKTNNNIGNIYFGEGDYDKAIECYSLGYEMSLATKNKKSQALCLGNIGNAHLEKGEFDVALNFLYQSLNISDKIGDKGGISSCLNLIPKVYLELKNNPDGVVSTSVENISFREIESMLLRAKKIAEESNDFNLQKNVFETLGEFYKNRGDYQSAFQYQEQSLSIKDSIYAFEKMNSITEMQTRFETENKIKENEYLKENNRLIHSRNKWYLITAISLLGLLLTGGYFYRQLIKVKEKLVVQNKTIETQKSELTKLNQTKDRFFGIIAHDLKSPLIAMQGLGKRINFLLQNNKHQQLLELGDQVDDTSTKLNDLLDNLLNWASLQTGDIPHHPQTLNFIDISEDVMALFENNAKTKSIQLNMDIDPSLKVHADERALNTILRNLISNAVKFTPKGGQVSLIATTQNNGINIVIKDTGEGISPERLKDLFTIKKKSTSGTAGEKGTGLGLVLCKELIELNQGQLKVSSQQGKGSQFEFTLPMPAPVHQKTTID